MYFCQSSLGTLLGGTNFPQPAKVTQSGTEVLL